MGCVCSTVDNRASPEFDKAKQEVQSSRFGNTTSVSWDGASCTGNTFTVVPDKTRKKEAGFVQDLSGKVLLNVLRARDASRVSFHEPGTNGKCVLLVCRTQMANFYTKTKETIWTLWTAEENVGGQREVTPTGASMYRLGMIRMPVGSPGLGYYPAASASTKPTMSLRTYTYSKGAILASDGVTPVAVVEDMTYPWFLRGTATFAQGIDPLVSFVMMISVVMNMGNSG